MKRRLFTYFSGGSLLLCTATCVLWASSYVSTFSVGRRTWQFGSAQTVVLRETGLASARGRLALGTRTRQLLAGATGGQVQQSVQWYWRGRSALGDDARARDWYGPLGFEFGFSLAGRGLGRNGWTLYLPYWFLCLITAAPPAFRVARAARKRRQARRDLNLCRRCGYDLRATPGRCPECGDVPPVRSTS
jgi:hypothetical protein